jgi:non-ribosomal peptide synthetase component F
LSYLSEEEEYKLLITNNDTYSEYPDSKTISEIFEEQAFNTPDSVSLVYKDSIITYKELNRISNQVAAYLRNKFSIQEGDLIAIMTDQPDKMVIGLLGILKSGAGYVPVDKSYPSDRIEFILRIQK